MDIFGQVVPVASVIFLAFALLLALSFEFVNGFHDTANAVATVIYTNSLKPTVAVVWSGIWNLIGVLTSTGAVAFSVLTLLPVELVLNVGSDAGFAMVFALLFSAILWNLGTWYLGLPASSSHTLIGSIMGVGLANALMNGRSIMDGINWAQVQSVFSALLLSPVIGFVLSALLLLVSKLLIKKPELYKAPAKGSAPPMWIRGLLVLTCTGVSFAHGSNDGQKGMGLMMLILIGVLPAAFALQLGTDGKSVTTLTSDSKTISTQFQAHSPATTLTLAAAETELTAYLGAGGKASETTWAAAAAVSGDIAARLGDKTDLNALANADRSALRQDMYLVSDSIVKLDKQGQFADKTEKATALKYRGSLENVTKYIPLWIKIVVAIALGLGTMIGWKRIVVTVGEKIGKEHLTYAQGASAELVAMGTIGLATAYGLPVSTTHVLSSGVAGTMAANGSGLQASTLRNIVVAWLLTLPVCVLLGAGVFSAAIYFVIHVLHGA
jgi:PiT family inorganic phosphate transporter